MNTTVAKKENVTPAWKIVDAKGQILGRLAVKIANALRGRDKAIYTPHVDTGDFVIVVNADKVKLTALRKMIKNTCSTLATWETRSTAVLQIFVKNRPEFIITNAVNACTPKKQTCQSDAQKAPEFTLVMSIHIQLNNLHLLPSNLLS